MEETNDVKKNKNSRTKKIIIRTIIGIILAIILAIVILIVMFFKQTGLGLTLNPNANVPYFEFFKEWITGANKVYESDVTNILITGENKLKRADEIEITKVTMIFSFDEKDICIGARYCLDYITEERALQNYETLKIELEKVPSLPHISNMRREGSKVIYNYNYWNNRKSKEDVINEFSDVEGYTIQEI